MNDGEKKKKTSLTSSRVKEEKRGQNYREKKPAVVDRKRGKRTGAGLLKKRGGKEDLSAQAEEEVVAERGKIFQASCHGASGGGNAPNWSSERRVNSP